MWTEHCDELPSVTNARPLNANTAVGHTINFTCETGFIMADNVSSVAATCLGNRTWDDDLANVSCERPLPF